MALRKAFPGLCITAVEPDAEVAAVAERFFGVPRGGDARLLLHTADGAAFLADVNHTAQVTPWKFRRTDAQSIANCLLLSNVAKGLGNKTFHPTLRSSAAACRAGAIQAWALKRPSHSLDCRRLPLCRSLPYCSLICLYDTPHIACGRASELLLWARSLTSSSSTQPCQTPPTQCACSRRRRSCSRPPRLPLCAGVCGALPLFLPTPHYLQRSPTLIAEGDMSQHEQLWRGPS